jgi:hypothetical protein
MLVSVRLGLRWRHGVYEIFFTVYTLGTAVTERLAFIGAEVHADAQPQAERLSVLRRSLPFGAAVALPTGAATLAASFVVPAGTATTVVTHLALTAAAATVLAPVQDHIRRMCYVAEMPWTAATVSGVQLVAAVVPLAGFWAADVVGSRADGRRRPRA